MPTHCCDIVIMHLDWYIAAFGGGEAAERDRWRNWWWAHTPPPITHEQISRSAGKSWYRWSVGLQNEDRHNLMEKDLWERRGCTHWISFYSFSSYLFWNTSNTIYKSDCSEAQNKPEVGPSRTCCCLGWEDSCSFTWSRCEKFRSLVCTECRLGTVDSLPSAHETRTSADNTQRRSRMTFQLSGWSASLFCSSRL